MSVRKKLDDRSRIAAAASLLGGMTSPRKRRTSAENGRLGGRPSSGLCSDRELRRRLRAWLHDQGSFTLRGYRLLCQDALAYRRDVMRSAHDNPGSTVDNAIRIVTNHPLASGAESWRLLLLQNPVLL